MEAIIFDVDGTLWDSTDGVAESWNQVIERETDLGRVITAERLHRLFGKTMDVIAADVFPDYSLEERSRLAELCFTYENDYLREHPGILYPGVAESMEWLAQKVPLFIASNCQCGYIEAFLDSTGLRPLVKDFICYGDTGLSKGKNIRILMERNGLTDAAYVGDTRGDEEACEEAGVPFIYAEYGFGEALHPAQVIRQFSDLKKLV